MTTSGDESGPSNGAHSRVDPDRRRAARRQADVLRVLQGGDRSASLRMIDRIGARRAGRTDHVQFDVEVIQGREVLPQRSELLAPAAQFNARGGQDIASAAGFRADSVQALDDRVVLLHRDGASRASLSSLRTDLAAVDIPSSFAYVTPNKIVMKSGESPRRLVGLPPSPGSSTTDPGVGPVTVAVLDTGIYASARTDGWLSGLENSATRDPLDVLPAPNKLLDVAAGHGTFIAGVVAQVDPALRIEVRRVLDTDGIASEVDVAVALVQVVRDLLQLNGRLVVNLSLGTETLEDQPPVALATALELVREHEDSIGGEVLIVTAAGNDSWDRRCWPAAFAEHDDKVVAVAALDLDLTPADWSTYGSWVTCSTVGEAVVSTFVHGREDPQIDPDAESFPPDAWAYWSGTSFAAPRVAAEIASRAHGSGSSLAAALHDLLATGQPTPGYGRRLDL